MKISVNKFGGTSVANALANLLAIVSYVFTSGERPVVVVSALAKVTNLLVKIANDRATARESFNEIEAIHMRWLRQHDLPEHILDEMLKALSDHVEDGTVSESTLVAYGERLAAIGVASALRRKGLSAIAVDASGAYHHDMVGDLVLETTGGENGNGAQPLEASLQLIAKGLFARLALGVIPVYTGFIGCDDRTCNVTNLGRGGSDYTASLLGAALSSNATVTEIVIWSDVEGMMSADPRVVSDKAFRIDDLSYLEAGEFAMGGGKLFPEALRPAAVAGVPVRMASTFTPNGRGTLIGSKEHVTARQGVETAYQGPLGVVLLRQAVLLTLKSFRMAGAHGFMSEATGILSDEGIAIGLIGTGDVEVAMTVQGGDAALQRALIKLKRLAEADLRWDVVLVTVLATNCTSKILASVFNSLADASIEVLALSMGTSRIALQLAVDAKDGEDAVRIIHQALFYPT